MTMHTQYVLQLKSFDIPTIKVSGIAINAADGFKEKRLKAEPKRRNILKATYVCGVKKSVINEYKIAIIKSILCNLLFQDQIPIKALNDFSLHYFGKKMNNNDIHDITTSNEYSHLFARNFKKGKSYSVFFDLTDKQSQEILSNIPQLQAQALAMFEEAIKRNTVETKPRKKI